MGRVKAHAQFIEDRGFDYLDGSLCLNHIKDKRLMIELEEEDDVDACRICGDTSTSRTSLDSVLSVVMEAVNSLFIPTYDDPYEFDQRTTDRWGILEFVCDEAFDSTSDDLLQLFVECVQQEDWADNPGSLEDTVLGWDQFVDDVKSASRFVFVAETRLSSSYGSPGQRSAGFLNSLLPYIENESLRLLTVLSSGFACYRGRLVSRQNDPMSLSKDLGPAPPSIARSNRMSPTGIPMFYASGSPATACRELAAHGPERYARIGKFVSLRELKVLDLTRLPKLPSPFDRERRHHHGILAFFTRFAETIAAPLEPGSVEELEYVPTQVVTEFFRWVPKNKIDGIKLKSAQDGKPTYVFFFTASDFTDGADINDTFNDGWRIGANPAFKLESSDVHTFEIKRSITAQQLPDKRERRQM
ncbi:RES domain-containing protein [Arthrobacter sp. N1]|uniref:RES domain-containing protein n=1 Tax=Arthrobacter sp. N1 TaxID=619291 RepID=UPI003BAE823D